MPDAVVQNSMTLTYVSDGEFAPVVYCGSLTDLCNRVVKRGYALKKLEHTHEASTKFGF
jgi:hypothetical protein